LDLEVDRLDLEVSPRHLDGSPDDLEVSSRHLEVEKLPIDAGGYAIGVEAGPELGWVAGNAVRMSGKKPATATATEAVI